MKQVSEHSKVQQAAVAAKAAELAAAVADVEAHHQEQAAKEAAAKRAAEKVKQERQQQVGEPQLGVAAGTPPDSSGGVRRWGRVHLNISRIRQTWQWVLSAARGVQGVQSTLNV